MRQRLVINVFAEGSLIAASIVATVSLERLFVDLTFLRNVLLMLVASHLVAIACRRSKFRVVLSAIISLAMLVLVGSAIFYPNASFYVFPTSETIKLLVDDLAFAQTVFLEGTVPVEPLKGFLVSASVFVWLGAFVADSVAFRTACFVEALIPASALVAFSAIVGVDRNQLTHGVAFAASLAAVLLSARALEQADGALWATGKARRGASTVLRVGAVMAVLAVVAGSYVAPRIPGADSQPLVDITELDVPVSTRNIVSPLVRVAASLVEQSDREVFSVKVAEGGRDYWRLMALTSFDGNQWARKSNFAEVRGPLDSTINSSVENRKTLTQTVTKRSLGSSDIYLPVAYELHRVLDDGGLHLEYELATGALVYHDDSQQQAEQKFSYTVESLIPDYDPLQLPQRAATNLSHNFLAEHTSLPPACGTNESATTNGCWPTRITSLAREITANAVSDYQRARLLQDYLRDPANFSYDLNVAERQSFTTIEEFLFDVRSGYCEQFATAFAAMARSLGIPTRVAVGYTWGSWDPQRGEYVVRGHHAHAWPEVYFEGVGWLLFEPTPSRSRPHDPDITGQYQPQQYDDGNIDGAASPALDVVPLPQGTNPSSSLAPPPTAPQDDAATNPPTVSPSSRTAEVIGAVLAVLAVIVVVAALTPTIRAMRRRKRLLRAANDPLQRAELAWNDALRALRLLGVSPEDHQTAVEFASEMRRLGSDLGPLEELADSVTTLRYSASSPSELAELADLDDVGLSNYRRELALKAKECSAQVADRAQTLAGVRRVVFAALNPRTLVDDYPRA